MNRLLALLILLFILSGCAAPLPEPVPTVEPASIPTPSPLPPTLPAPTLIPTGSPWDAWVSSDDNLAFKKHVRVSHAAYGSGGPAAVDGNPRTQWNSGQGPMQWIEIDLGTAYDIQEIRLLPYRHLPGVTVHTILGKGSQAGAFETLYTFESQLSDSPLLARASPAPWRNIRFVRIETSFSPVSIGWREIEVLRAVEQGMR
jgi:hypothetical protein